MAMSPLRSLLVFVMLAFLAVVPRVRGLGINCGGSAYCTLNGSANGYEAQTLSLFINGVDDNRYYKGGEHIACTPANICAFLQKTDGARGADIKRLAHYIPDHGCTICGSVPTHYPDDNDVEKGELTFNYVSGPKCGNGLC
ncbi:MAG: hypothetical protein M1839_007005 [Geoglossum umbratile]|nr:MAG: hypothetical protein M1839_007005 [Geoglossum umbratile]